MIRGIAARGPDLSRILVEFEGEGEEHDELNEEHNTNAHHTRYNPVCSRWPEPPTQ